MLQGQPFSLLLLLPLLLKFQSADHYLKRARARVPSESVLCVVLKCDDHSRSFL